MTRHFVDLAVFLAEGAATIAFSEKKLVLDLQRYHGADAGKGIGRVRRWLPMSDLATQCLEFVLRFLRRRLSPRDFVTRLSLIRLHQ